MVFGGSPLAVMKGQECLLRTSLDRSQNSMYNMIPIKIYKNSSKYSSNLFLVKFSLPKGKFFLKPSKNTNPNVSLALDIPAKLPGVDANIKLRDNPAIKRNACPGTLK